MDPDVTAGAGGLEEDLLYTLPAVREVAVIGVSDPERGETVKAFVSLKAGASVTRRSGPGVTRPSTAIRLTFRL